jgi:SAM-dependent methyltransferase
LIDHDNLEEFADPRTYDIEDDTDMGVAFYTALARETGGPLLELACGTGRVSIPIARLGFAVTGLDIVPGMVESARSKSAGLPARWAVGDARTFDLGERCRLIFLAGNAFQAFLTRADQEVLLARVRAHLHDDGLFAFETRTLMRPASPMTTITERLQTGNERLQMGNCFPMHRSYAVATMFRIALFRNPRTALAPFAHLGAAEGVRSDAMGGTRGTARHQGTRRPPLPAGRLRPAPR